MKKFKKFICFLLVVVSALSINNVKIFAGEIEYTENVIPVMTSENSSYGKVSASSFYDYDKQGYTLPAYHAFDHNITQLSAWDTAVGVTTGWLQYEFTEAKCITKYAVIPRTPTGFEGEQPKDWTFEAWNENTAKWDVLDTQKNITDWKAGVKKEYILLNTVSYHKYRINITANCGFANYTSIGELEMMETKTPTPPPTIEGNKAILEVVMTNGTIKEYDLTAEELDKFLTWYDDRSNGSGKSYYKIPKRSNVKPFISRNEYLSYDKIYSFEVKDYNE